MQTSTSKQPRKVAEPRPCCCLCFLRRLFLDRPIIAFSSNLLTELVQSNPTQWSTLMLLSDGVTLVSSDLHISWGVRISGLTWTCDSVSFSYLRSRGPLLAHRDVYHCLPDFQVQRQRVPQRPLHGNHSIRSVSTVSEIDLFDSRPLPVC